LKLLVAPTARAADRDHFREEVSTGLSREAEVGVKWHGMDRPVGRPAALDGVEKMDEFCQGHTAVRGRGRRQMVRDLPPLNALRAFEAAARRLSFTRAAEELGVTQAAVSHHVKVLEKHLGFRLFRRLNNGLMLSEKGEAYLPTVRNAFDALCEATDVIQGQAGSQMLTLSVLPNFALRWLVPRLAEFQRRNAGIDVRLLTAYRGTDFLREDIDAAIRLGADWPGLNADRLFGSDMFPVCSPVVAAERPLREPRDLAHHLLLHVYGAHDDWPVWLAAAGAGNIASDRGPSFDSYALALEAAAHGCGVAMARSVFVQDDLASGRLIAPFSLPVKRSEAWYFLWPKTGASRKVLLFRSWLLARAAQTRASLGHSFAAAVAG
jgi:LysR family transcriptional regulator, glycine cleavage system transcriptional activator